LAKSSFNKSISCWQRAGKFVLSELNMRNLTIILGIFFLFKIVPSSAQILNAPLPLSGLIGWWPGEGNAGDLVGTNPGVVANSVEFTNGLIGQAFQFHGGNDSVEIANSTELNPQIFTIEAWIYPLLSQPQSLIVAKGENSDPSGLNLQLVSNSAGTFFLTGSIWGVTNYWSPSIELQGTNLVPLNQWTHVAMTLDNQGARLYVNGAPDSTTEATPAFALIALTNSAPLSIGGGPGPSFNGLIDEVAFYGTALSADEIQRTYAVESLGGSLLPQVFSPPQNVSPGIGTDISLRVTAFSPGGTALFYQWFFNGISIAGATNSSLVLKNMQPSDSGQYSVTISNAAGAVTNSSLVSVAGVIAWGIPTDYIPSGLISVKAIACGGSHNVALRADGTVVAWGDNVQGQTSVPSGLSNVVAIAAGDTYSLALTGEGQMVGWGIGPLTAPLILTNVVEIAGSDSVAWALETNGVLVGWNSFGSLVTPPEGWTNLVGIAAGAFHLLGLKEDGTVVASGDNSYGQTNVPTDLTNVVAVAANLFHSLALKSDGTVVAWGELTRNFGLTNIPPNLSNVVAIAAGETFNLALRADGTVVAWGQDMNGNPMSSPTLPNTVSIAAGYFHGLALLRDGSPQITVQPWDRKIAAGTTASLTTKTVGIKSTVYQWQFNGKNIDGATNDIYTIADAEAGDAGNYSLLASNNLGVAITRQARVVVSSSSYPLSVLRVGNRIALSWSSVGASNILLEEANSFSTSTIWVLSGATFSDDGTNKTATVSTTGSARFFRLARKQ
jgi:alpha-tubulin suppressor-like RCC1 family protein